MARRFIARYARSEADIRAAQALRGQVFRGGAPDADRFDQNCAHVLIEDQLEDRLVCAFRIQLFESATEIGGSYAAQFYDLFRLRTYPGKLAEMGRFCVEPGYNDPDILRIAWAALTRYVDANNVKLLFGCSSFDGAEAGMHLEAFALLKDRHLAPREYLPEVKAPKVYCFSRSSGPPDMYAAQKAMPPLLRSYLLMGGWVSDHAVVDRDLDTIHVFTGLEIGAIPARRKKLLRAAAMV
ncbi:MAG: GNAT family N-acetyltransferase [Rhodobacteraceae bacterium]|nr:GNAT family N-acetyltransferase [Paracoccaceae bacterium]